MRGRTKRLVVITISITLLSAAFGATLPPPTTEGVVSGAVIGGLIGFFMTMVEIQANGTWAHRLKRYPMPVLFVARMLTYAVAFVVIPNLGLVVLRQFDPAVAFDGVLNNHNLALSFIFAFVINFVMVLRRMLGMKYLIAIGTGRYHRAREEERIVAFMDLKGSTALAERLGTARYHEFLNEVFFDLADPIMESGGTVYQYVGDEVVVTWPAARGLRNASCVGYFFAVEDALARRRQAYMAAYDAMPALRGALHIGPLMVGEIGDLNRQIVMIGDTMNTASRIEGACRKFGRDYVASAEVLNRIAQLPRGIRSESLGPVPLAGKAGEMELCALVRG